MMNYLIVYSFQLSKKYKQKNQKENKQINLNNLESVGCI